MNRLQEYHARLEKEHKDRVNAGLQCPKCLQVSTESTPNALKYHCEKCGFQWDSNYFSPKRRSL